ncbi:hypothetical protein [Roseospira visakhapatnamensis]|uniref:Uncharacterized protein n=1 Tax=Roseospira visakhapatnamensis TaxID=390880 RepID=A0A7W6RFY3_9PROT|nr:hypothetical protein [Roseospira visakhapatnamensis]MBB4267727.1 hypothetical protein [Roseospira visakhapatnamensis]
MLPSFPMAALMRQMGEPATLTTAGGDALATEDGFILLTEDGAALITESGGEPISLYAKRVGGGREVTVGDVRLVVEDLSVHILRADATPVAGQTITIGAETWTIQAVEPLPNDPQATRWSLRLTWGVTLTLRTPGAGGGGSPYDPVPDTITLTARAAGAGALAITLVASGWTSGRIRAGDVLIIGGASYTATADVALILAGQSWVFAAVPITPPLAAPVAEGAAVTVTAPAVETRTAYAAPAEWTAEEIAGGIATSDQRFVIRATPGAVPPTTSDLVRVGAETRDRQVTGVRTIYAGASVAAWVIGVAS